MTRKDLESIEGACVGALHAAKEALDTWDNIAEHNVFDTLETACDVMVDTLLTKAHNDCEGSYTCGADQYTRNFIVGGVKYLGILDCLYNRHDKTYYYVDEYAFSYHIV